MNYNTVIKLTNEQKNIINFIKDGNNLIIKARAGCAKTTTCLHSIKSIKRKKVLFLLFNKMLKIDLHNKINKMFKKDEKVNIVSNNYHSFVIDFYNQINGTYSDIINVCENNIYPTNNMDFDIIFIDEAQDLDLLLCTFLNKIINDIFNFKKIYPQLIFIGDDLQQIYGFKSSDCKYFLNANEYFNNNKNVWISSVLNTTFRFNIKHANYINNIYNKQIIKSNLITNFDVTSIKDTEENILINFVFNDIKNKINSGSFYDDFFVIAPSIKYRNSLIKKIENILVFNDIPCFHTLTDYDELNYEYIKNKIVFTTFHQTKGLERDYVYIILSNKEEKVENSLYVACTRMKKQLVIVNYIYSTNNKKDNNKKYIKLTEFIKNIHPTLEYIIYEKYIKRNINIINKYDKKDKILKNNIKLLFKSKNNIFIYENIENINNKAIMRWFEYNFFNKITFLDNFIKNQYLKNSSKEICNLYDIYNNKKDITLSFIYKLCLEEEYMNNGFIFRKKYINTDQYFSDNFLNKSILNNLKEKIGNSKYKFEYSLFDKTLKLIANFDVIDDENKKIYYIKISNNIINQKDIMQFYLNMIIIEFYHKRKETYQHIIFNPVTLEEIHLIFKKDLANIIHKKLLDELQYSDKINE